VFDSEMNRINNKYKILEKTYLFLGIVHRKDKCIDLKNIITKRDIYYTNWNRGFARVLFMFIE